MPSTWLLRLQFLAMVSWLTILFLPATVAQPINPASEQLPPAFLPRSPVAAVFPRYGSTSDVNLLTGAPQLSLPLTTLTSGSLQLSVSLSYNYSGLLVMPALELVGLGWRLQAGGSITRRVQGTLDDSYSHYDNTTLTGLAYDNDFYRRQNFLRNVAEGNWGFDTQPDLYTVSLPDYNGDFLVIGDKVVPLTIADARIELVHNAFVVTLASGATYQFDTPERTDPVPANFSKIGSHISSWHLSRVVSANRQDTIQLHYTMAPYQEPQRMAMNILEKRISSVFPSQQLFRLNQYGTRQVIPLLDCISTRTERVVFERGSGTTASQYPLQAVRIYSRVPAEKLDRTFTLRQSYYDRLNGQASDRLRLDEVQEVAATGQALPAHTFAYESSVPMPEMRSLAQDHWGYYNGQQGNVTLMPFAEPAFAANRQPNFAFAQGGALRRVTYPTGGSKEFVYEANDYRISPYSITRYDEQEVVVTPFSSPLHSLPVPGSNSPTLTPVTLQEGSFTLTRLDTIELVTRRNWATGEDSVRSGGFNRFPEAALYRYTPTGYELAPGLLCEVFRSYPSEEARSNTRRDVLVLPAGTYKLIAYCEAQETVTACTIRFPKLEWVHQKPGPGIRVKQTTTYSGRAGMPVECRRYTYAQPDGYSSGRMLLPLTDQGEPAYKRERYQKTEGTLDPSSGGQILTSTIERCFSIVTDLASTLNKYTYFYQAVTETALANEQPNGKTVTYYANFAEERQEVRPTGKRIYAYGQQGYTLVQREKTTHFRESPNNYFMLEPYVTADGGSTAASGIAKQYDFYSTVIPVIFCAPDSLVTTAYGPTGQDSIQTVTSLRYTNYLPTQRLVSQSDGSRLLYKSKYLQQYDSTLPDLKFLRTHYFNPLVEEQIWKVRPGADDHLLGGTITLFDTTAYAPASRWRLDNPDASHQLSSEALTVTGQYRQLLSDGRYRQQQAYHYSAAGNLAQVQAVHALPTAYIWGYQQSRPIAAVRNAALTQVAYTSFEAGEASAWQPTGGRRHLTAGYTGTASYYLGGGSLRRTSLPTGTYVVSCWLKEHSGTVLLNGQPMTPTATVCKGWRFCQQVATLTGPSSCTLSGTGQVDEVRLCPAGAQLTSYTYDSLGNLSGQMSPDGRSQVYEYDGLGRLMRTRDEQGRILTQQQYHYTGH
jgi:YD repeat-containing protein